MTLGPEAKALVEASRGALRPTEADRSRVLDALRGRIAAQGAQGAGAPPAAIAQGVGWPTLAAAVAGLCVVGGVLLFSVDRGNVPPAPPSTAVMSAPVEPPVVNPPATPNGAELPPIAALESLPPKAEAKAAPAPSTRRPSDRLAEEVAILSRAETELHAGHYAGALRVLDEHQRTFPRGSLTQERVAARIQALCALGRVSQADAELAVLTRSSPGSPHEGRARAACAGRPAP